MSNSVVFWRNHLYYPLAVFIALVLVIELGHIDMLLADFFYRLEGGTWALRNAWFTSKIIHQAGRTLSLLVCLSVIIAIGLSFFNKKLELFRRECVYLLVAAGGGSLMISALKLINHASCPWDFARYGGQTPEYATVFAELLHGSGQDCFPAAHASAGYAWVAIYFLGVHLNKSWRWVGLATALSVGIIFGFSQQLRGAHFISHDVWTLAICWGVSLLSYKYILMKHPKTI